MRLRANTYRSIYMYIYMYIHIILLHRIYTTHRRLKSNQEPLSPQRWQNHAPLFDGWGGVGWVRRRKKHVSRPPNNISQLFIQDDWSPSTPRKPIGTSATYLIIWYHWTFKFKKNTKQKTVGGKGTHLPVLGEVELPLVVRAPQRRLGAEGALCGFGVKGVGVYMVLLG